ncbi:MAG TPA: hypothetical protein VMV54_01160 [Acidocella sp.]|nr:hypothetical protein [Acidocella sp.]
MDFRTPWDTEAPPPESGTRPGGRTKVDADALPTRKGRRPTPLPDRLPAVAPFFLYNQLTVIGPQPDLAAFAAAARGPGVIPWQLDFDAIEEDIFNLAVSQPPAQRRLTVAGCRLLARQFRERVEARQAKAAACLGASLAHLAGTYPAGAYPAGACPFDLQILLPVPREILNLGPTHPAAVAWLQRHWGTADSLRHIEALPAPRPGKRLPAGHAVIGYGFFTWGQPPAAAIAAIAASWPALHLRLRYRPSAQDGGWTG